jgi:nucleotide-binding universal stress UspA family protein
MREEARDRINAHFQVFAKWMREKHKVDPELIIREGEIVSEILAQIKDDSEVDILVLGAGTDRKGPGPLVTQLSKSSGNLEVPIVIVPGSLSKAQLEAIV